MTATDGGYFPLEEDLHPRQRTDMRTRLRQRQSLSPARVRMAGWILGFSLLCAGLLCVGLSFSSMSPSHPQIAIFQHFNLHDERIHRLQILSRTQHERYAQFWGYRYYTSTEQFVPEDDTTVRQRQMNKVYGLLQVVLGELAKGHASAEWIHITDADVLVVDPSVPLHALLPPTSPSGVSPFIIGSEDGNGYNSGNVIYRCNVELAAYLAHTIAMSDNITKEYDRVMNGAVDGKEPKGLETPPSDQRALCLVLERNEAFASRFFHYPQRWLNSYDLPPDSGSQIQLHTHLVAGRKYRDEYDQYEEAERRVWRWIRERSGPEMDARVEQITTMAREHWLGAKIGLPHCIWI